MIFDEDIGSALRKACNIDELQCTRHILHKLCVIKNCSVYGSFKPSHEQDVIPPSLMGLVRMILDGPNIKHQPEVAATTTRAVLNIYIVEYGRDVDSSHGHHNNCDCETLLTLYVALKVHAVT